MTEKLKKKPRMTCKEYCPVWNDVDKDCEIYGEHHFTPRTCPHYNLEILEKKMTEKFIEDMLQKTENVANNVANENSQDLTEQWKKGELPEGHYYIKTRSETNIDEYIQWYKDHGIPSEKSFAYFNVQQVLAPVPSYDEYKDLKSKLQLKETAYDFDTARLEEENAQLKEQINKYYLDVINRGTANAVKAVKEFGMPERIKELVEQNTQLKELLKECELWFTGMVGNMNDKNVGEHNKSVPIGNFEYIFKEFSQKIKGALK